jgi:hypothetical protein
MRVVHFGIGSSLVWFLEHLDNMLCFATRPMVEHIHSRSLVGFRCGSFILIYSSFGGGLLFALIFGRSSLPTTILDELLCDLYLDG